MVNGSSKDSDVADEKKYSRKLEGWEFYEKILGSPKHVVGIFMIYRFYF